MIDTKKKSRSFRTLPEGTDLNYRVSTYTEFLNEQLSNLSSTAVIDQQNKALIPPPWKTFDIYEQGNPISGLMEGWSMVLDILTFYQERLLNEGFLQTAREYRSVLELGSEVGYIFSKGLPATTYLAFTTVKPSNPQQPITIPKFIAIKGIPQKKGELAPVFETTQTSLAYYEWNAIPVKSFTVQTSLPLEPIPDQTSAVDLLDQKKSVDAQPLPSERTDQAPTKTVTPSAFKGG